MKTFEFKDQWGNVTRVPATCWQRVTTRRPW
jgi:hypothetical protein